mmetsp:Transcript_48211/g.114719  ORF Transcript_48211/g.114719 Transcript_48211/m.114719 type:complete len:212 (+) Transcript_48211:540-1175(+)
MVRGRRPRVLQEKLHLPERRSSDQRVIPPQQRRRPTFVRRDHPQLNIVHHGGTLPPRHRHGIKIARGGCGGRVPAYHTLGDDVHAVACLALADDLLPFGHVLGRDAQCLPEGVEFVGWDVPEDWERLGRSVLVFDFGVAAREVLGLAVDDFGQPLVLSSSDLRDVEERIDLALELLDQLTARLTRADGAGDCRVALLHLHQHLPCQRLHRL